jgi:hypothetical protein
MRNCLECPYPLYFDREGGLDFGSHGVVCNPSESGESGSANYEIPLPAKKFSLEVLLFWLEFWCGESCHNELFSCSFISSISLCILSICSFAWLIFSSFSEAFLLASGWFENLSYFWSWSTFWFTLSSYLSTAWSSSSSASSSANGSRVCVVFSALALRRASTFALHSWSVICEGSAVIEIPLSSPTWWSSWSASIDVFFLDFFRGGIVDCFSTETTVSANVGESENKWDPRTRDSRTNTRKQERIGDKESPKVWTRLKCRESLYTWPLAPFYKETKGLLHSEITLESKEYS